MLPDNLDKLLQQALDAGELHDGVHPQAIEWYTDHINELYGRFHTPTLKWLTETAEENGRFASIPQEIRMAAYCIGAETYSHAFHKDVAVGATPEEDFLLSLFRTLVLIGWHLRESSDKGEFNVKDSS